MRQGGDESLGGETTGEMAYIWGRIGGVEEESRGEKIAIWRFFFLFGRQGCGWGEKILGKGEVWKDDGEDRVTTVKIEKIRDKEREREKEEGGDTRGER